MAKRAQAQVKAINRPLVDRYLDRLRKAGSTRSDFDTVVAHLAADKTARKAEVVCIASEYLGTSLRSKHTKLDAVQIIRKRFVELVRSQRELEIASKTTPA